jgi:hypothetical protein
LPYRIFEKLKIVQRSKTQETLWYLHVLTTVMAFLPILFTVFMLPVYFGWALIRAVPTTLRLAIHSTPLIFAILVVIFVTGDAWRLFGSESVMRFAALMLIIFILGVAAIGRVVSKDPNANTWRDTIWQCDTYKDSADKTPAVMLVKHGFEIPGDLRKGSAWTQGLTTNIQVLFWFMVISQLIAVALWISFIFVLLGFIVANTTATADLLNGGSPTIIWQFNHLGQSFILTRQLVFLSVTLGAVAIITFPTLGMQDENARKAFVKDCQDGLQKPLAALAYYMAGLNKFVTEFGFKEQGWERYSSTSIWLQPFLVLVLLRRVTRVMGVVPNSDQEAPAEGEPAQPAPQPEKAPAEGEPAQPAP